MKRNLSMKQLNKIPHPLFADGEVSVAGLFYLVTVTVARLVLLLLIPVPRPAVCTLAISILHLKKTNSKQPLFLCLTAGDPVVSHPRSQAGKVEAGAGYPGYLRCTSIARITTSGS